MRQLPLAAGVLCAAGVLAYCAVAQNTTAMPGKAVGTGFNFKSVGTQFPQAGSKVGQPVNIPADTPLMRRADPSKPFDVFRGTTIDPSSVAAPVAGFGNQTGLEKFYDKLKSVFGLTTKAPVTPAMNVTPGIFRRNRERANEQMWRRD